MDVLAELLPPSYTAKAEPSARDSRRHQQHEKKQQNEPEPELKSDQETIKITANPLPETERRNGEDRRQQRMNRGRWLESRARNDRRAKESAIFVKV